MSKEKINPIVQWTKWRIDKNKNLIIIFNGPTGSGKTYAALRYAEEVSELMGTPFTIKGNVDFNFSELLRKTMRPENQEPGTVFLFEEVGAFGGGASSKQWQTKANMFFNSFLQTTRHRRQVLIMTCPHFSSLDASSRKLVHMQVDMVAINPKNRQSYSKPYILQVNNRTGKIYFKLLRFKQGNMQGRLSKWILKHPSKEAAQEYEYVKTKYTDALNKTILKKDEPKSTVRGKVDREILKEMVKKNYSNKELAEKFRVTISTVKYHKQMIKKSMN